MRAHGSRFTFWPEDALDGRAPLRARGRRADRAAVSEGMAEYDDAALRMPRGPVTRCKGRIRLVTETP